MRKIMLLLIGAGAVLMTLGLSNWNEGRGSIVLPESTPVPPQPSPTISLMLGKPFDSPAKLKEEELKPLLAAAPTPAPSPTAVPRVLKELSRIGVTVDENKIPWVHYDFSDKSTVVRGAESQPPPAP